MGQTVKIPDNANGASFRDLATKIAATLTATPLDFVTVEYKGSYSWTGDPTTTFVNETIWKLCYWEKNNWSFGVRKEYVEEAGWLAEATPLCPEHFNVLPKSDVEFIGFPVKNDAASLARIMRLIATVVPVHA